MKVLMINGSRREKGCTYTALNIIAETLKEEGIESVILYIGGDASNGNINEAVKTAAEKMKTSDALIVGSPVYYASATGEVISFLDRFFGMAGADLAYKPAAAISSARRAGTLPALDDILHYFEYSNMVVVSSRYWNMVFGSKPEDVLKDVEGIQIMKTLGKNMAWMLKTIEAGKAAGVKTPDSENKVFFNYIRE